jgi:cyclase
MDMNPKSVAPLFLFFLLPGIAIFAQQPNAPAAVTLQQVAPNIYMTVGGRGAQGGVYIGEKEVLLIDSKQDAASVGQVLSEIRKLTNNPVTRLVNTHADSDHVFGNRFLPAGVSVIAHENCLKEFFIAGMGGQASDWNKPELKAFLPSVTYKDRMVLQVGAKNIELWYFGVGHTTGDTVVYFPDEKVAFIGDQLFVGRVQLIHAYKGGSSLGEVAALEKMLATIDARRFVSGHSDIQDRSGVQNHIANMKAVQEKVRGLKAKGLSLEDIRKQFTQAEAALVGVIFDEIR